MPVENTGSERGEDCENRASGQVMLGRAPVVVRVSHFDVDQNNVGGHGVLAQRGYQGRDLPGRRKVPHDAEVVVAEGREQRGRVSDERDRRFVMTTETPTITMKPQIPNDAGADGCSS